jgi:Mg-chelatase subunit ChlD
MLQSMEIRLHHPGLAACALGLAASCAPPPAPVSVEIPVALPQTASDPTCQPSEIALVVVLDRSGSMAGAPIEWAKAGTLRALEDLSNCDLFEVVAFDTRATRAARMALGRERRRLAADVRRIMPGGGTEFLPALKLAHEDLQTVQARRRHVVLLSDGRAATGGLRDLATTMAAQGISISTIAFGGDADADLLRMLADAGKGRFHQVSDPAQLPEVFFSEVQQSRRAAP